MRGQSAAGESEVSGREGHADLKRTEALWTRGRMMTDIEPLILLQIMKGFVNIHMSECQRT